MTRFAGRRRGGFTLIEVLLVLVILVVLASLAVVAYGPVQRRAKFQQAKAQIGLFKTALDMFQLSCGAYPSAAQGLEALRSPPPDVPAGKWDGPYLDSPVPPDPWDNPYQYVSPGAHFPESYDIWCISPEGIEIGNWNLAEVIR